MAAKHRVRAWVRLLALTAATEAPWRAVTVARGRTFGLQIATAGPVGVAEARAALAELVALRGEGLREPLPLPLGAAGVYAKVLGGSHDPAGALAEAAAEWDKGRERADDPYVRVWGPGAPAAAFTGAPDPAGGQPTRFGALAVRLWEPLLRAEELVRR